MIEPETEELRIVNRQRFALRAMWVLAAAVALGALWWVL